MNTAKKSPQPVLTNELLARLIDIGRREAFDEYQQLLADFPRARSGNFVRQRDPWIEVAQRYSSDDVKSLIKALTVAERDLPHFGGGSASPVITLYHHLFDMPNADLTELRDWVVAHTRNDYLPFGQRRYRPATFWEYFRETQEHERERQEKKQSIENARAERHARIREREIHIQEGREPRNSRMKLRMELIASLQYLSSAERLEYIIGDAAHPVFFYPVEWAVLSSKEILVLPPMVRLAAIRRLSDCRKGNWRKLRMQLEQSMVL